MEILLYGLSGICMIAVVMLPTIALSMYNDCLDYDEKDRKRNR